MKKVIIFISIAVIIIAAVLLSPTKSTGKGKKVQTQSLQTRSIESITLGSGYIDYSDVRKLNSEITAKVKKIWIKEGQVIEKGQLLIELDPKELQDRINQLEVALTLRETDLQRSKIQLNTLNRQLADQKVLLKQNLASKSQIDSIDDQIVLAKIDLKTKELNLTNAKDDLLSAQKNLDKSKIYAPISGLISYLNISEGELVVANNVGQSFVSISDTTKIIANVDIDETSIKNIKVGQSVRLFPAGNSDEIINAQVIEIAVTAREVAGRLGRIFKVKVLLDTQINEVVRPGMSARVEIVTARVEEIPSLNIVSIFDKDDKKQVWVVENEKAVARDVTLGVSDDEFIEIKTGIKEGDVVISGPSRTISTLKEGDAINVENVEPEINASQAEIQSQLNSELE